MILAIALFGVLVISAVAAAPEAYASGGIMSLTAHYSEKGTFLMMLLVR
jgi:hypothetical protein